MKTRIISAAVGLVLLVAVVCFFETAVLDVAVAALSAIAVYEMVKAVKLNDDKGFALICAAFGAFFSSTYFSNFGSLSEFIVLAYGIVLLLYAMRNHKEVKVTDIAFVFMFTVMLPKAFSVLLLFRNQGAPYSYFFALLSLAVAWFNDTCAYFTGYFLGKHKLCPEISPKKTVEGAIGGVFGDVILCSVLAIIFSNMTQSPINWVSFVLFLPVGAIIGILGDLCASVIKRQVGIKDYGNIMPGHGGVMDRFDSWVFVAPVLYIWNIYFPII